MRTAFPQLIPIVSGLGLLAACTQELPPRSTNELIENPMMLEAAMVRCSQDRDGTRYDAECVNAREAVKQIEAKAAAARRVELDARSEIRRKELRRKQEAAAEARRQAAESARLRKEAEYLAQFGASLPPKDPTQDEGGRVDNSPSAVIPESEQAPILLTGPGDILPATDGGNAPTSIVQPEPESLEDDLQQHNGDEVN